jgi:hypothetical protein
VGAAALFATIATLAATAAAAQQRPTVSVSLGGRAQFQYSTTSLGEEELGEEAPASNTFEARRIRLRVDLDIGDWITARIQPDIAQGDLRVADAYIDFGLSDYLNLKVGQFKRSFSRIELTSSLDIPTIERGVRIAGLDDYLGMVPGEHYEILGASGYVGRDLGASLRGGTDRFGWELGVFNGEGADSRDINDDKTVAGRFTVAPAAGRPLELGAGVQRRDTPAENGWAYEFDAEWGSLGSPGMHLLAEAAFGDDLTAATDAGFAGVHGILSWYGALSGDRFQGIELVGRASWGDPDGDLDDDEGLLLTPGLNLYVFGRNRIRANWDLYLPSADALESQNAFRAQAQIYF